MSVVVTLDVSKKVGLISNDSRALPAVNKLTTAQSHSCLYGWLLRGGDVGDQVN